MKTFTTLFAAITIGFSAFAQAVPDASFTDCNGNTRSVYAAIGSGKVLLVANAGINCSICMSHAQSVASVANNNPTTIEVWGSMTTKTGGAVTCNAISSWVTTYGWGNVFSFNDANKYWFVSGTPRYTVINPVDSTVAYAGSNWNTAKQTAENLANSSIGIDENATLAMVYLVDDVLRISAQTTLSNAEISLYSLTGQRIQVWQVAQLTGSVNLPLPSALRAGLYVVRIRAAGKEFTAKVIK
jgi:hypothetical protein